MFLPFPPQWRILWPLILVTKWVCYVPINRKGRNTHCLSPCWPQWLQFSWVMVSIFGFSICYMMNIIGFFFTLLSWAKSVSNLVSECKPLLVRIPLVLEGCSTRKFLELKTSWISQTKQWFFSVSTIWELRNSSKKRAKHAWTELHMGKGGVMAPLPKSLKPPLQCKKKKN